MILDKIIYKNIFWSMQNVLDSFVSRPFKVNQ